MTNAAQAPVASVTVARSIDPRRLQVTTFHRDPLSIPKTLTGKCLHIFGFELVQATHYEGWSNKVHTVSLLIYVSGLVRSESVVPPQMK